jgi:hypothetical protein
VVKDGGVACERCVSGYVMLCYVMLCGPAVAEMVCVVDSWYRQISCLIDDSGAGGLPSMLVAMHTERTDECWEQER